MSGSSPGPGCTSGTSRATTRRPATWVSPPRGWPSNAPAASRADIGCVIVATVTPDYHLSRDGQRARREARHRGQAAFDIEIACSGFIYGLTVASSLIQAGVYERVLLVGSEKLSSITNYEDRGTAVLFGDGAGAVVLEAAERNDFLASELGSDGSDPSLLAHSRRRHRRAADGAGIARSEQDGHEGARSVSLRRHQDDRSHRPRSKAGLSRDDITYDDSASSESPHHRCRREAARDARR
jgi:3-oxoacyl-[acyl-carrier-protein] synthase III